MTLLQKASNLNENFVIALDGPSASGKGLIGSMLAKEFSLVYVQSSILYRAVAYLCISNNISQDDVDSIISLSKNADLINQVSGVDLNTESIGDFASKISVLRELRENLGVYLKNLIKTTPRIIMEGRDIGTIIAPDADLKIFITANVEIRSERRFKQLRMEGKKCSMSDVLGLLKSRDERDVLRDVAPLKVATDAFVVDTTDLSPVQVIQKIKNFIH